MSSEFFFQRVLNPFMKVILGSPLHRLVSENIMLIKFTGRKSGRQYTTPIGYLREGDTVICLTHARWWRNLRGGAQVFMRIRGQDYVGNAEPVPDDTARTAEAMRKFLVAYPSWARFYEIILDEDGTPKPEDLERAAESAVLIEIKLHEMSRRE